MQTPSTNKMEAIPVSKLLLSLSLPVMFSMTIQALFNTVDSVFVARFSEKALSAVALTFPMQTLMTAISIGTCIGINAFLSRTLGERNLEKAQTIAQHGALLALLSSFAFFLIGLLLSHLYFAAQTSDAEVIAYGTDYMSICLVFSLPLFGQQLFEKLLQANGRAVLSMVSQLVGAAMNVVLDPLLIFGMFGFPALGTKGAAIATVIGQATAFAIAFVLNQRCNKEVRLSFTRFSFDAAVIKQIYRIGLPSIVLQSLGSVTGFLLNGILLGFSTTATAFYGAYSKMQLFIFMPIFGLSAGVLPVVSYNIGAGRKERVIDALRSSILFTAGIMIAGTALFQIAPNQLIGLFGASEEMNSIGVPALRIISSYFFLEGICLISQTCFQALGRGMASLVCSLTRQILILLPVAYALSLLGDISYVWLAFPITGIIGIAVCLVQWRSVYKKNVMTLPSPSAERFSPPSSCVNAQEKGDAA